MLAAKLSNPELIDDADLRASPEQWPAYTG
jgi:hypothetical protein